MVYVVVCAKSEDLEQAVMERAKIGYTVITHQTETVKNFNNVSGTYHVVIMGAA